MSKLAAGTYVAPLRRAVRKGNSAEGNPIYTLTLIDSAGHFVVLNTARNVSCAYSLSEREYGDVLVSVDVSGRGTVTNIDFL